MGKYIAAGIFFLLVLACATAFAGVIKLKNGDEITGRILKRTDTHIEIETKYGKLIIPRNTIASIQERVRVHLAKDRRIEGEIVSRTEDEVRLKTPFGELTIPAKDIVRIEPLDGEEPVEKKGPKAGPEKEDKPRPTGDVDALRQEAHQHLQNKEWQQAIDAYKKILEIDPGDSNALYNTACAYSLLEKKAQAVEFLQKAVEAGFVDFGHIQRDPDLDNIREEEGYRKLLEEKEKHLAGNADRIIEKYKKRLGDEYDYIKDDDYKLVVISNVGKNTLDGLVNALHAYADSHWKDFFKHKPEYFITVLIPKNSEEYAKKFGGRQGAAGFYNPGTKTLTVNLATGGGTMIHEFTHALHYADMEGLGQRHPIWVVEGFGSLYEQCTRREGSGYGLLNWRLPILKSAIANGTCFPVKDFISNSSSFFRRDMSLSYAMARYLFYFMQEKKLLRKWYAKYRENYDGDGTGLKTLEEVYGKGIEEFEKDWLEFIKPLEYSRGGGAGPARPFIGVQLEEADKGLKITEVVKGSPAEQAGLRSGDIVLKMQDKEIKTLSDLRAVVVKHKIGDEVRFAIEREGEEKEITLKLGKRQ